jgi:cellulose synthase operon protein YhjQ
VRCARAACGPAAHDAPRISLYDPRMPLIAFTSPKGGVGKTTVAAHIAAILAQRGHKVVAIDLDPQSALRLHLGVSLREERSFLGRIDARPPWREALVETESGVRVLPFGAVDPLRSLELSQVLMGQPNLLADPVREMLAVPDLIVVLDSPPGPNAALAALMPYLDLMVVLLLADAGSAALIPQIANNRFLGRGTLATRMGERSVVVLNQVDSQEPLSNAVFDLARNALGTRLIGAICRDQDLAEALADRRMLTHGEHGAGEDLNLLADALIRRLKLPQPRAGAGFAALNEWGRT